MHQEQIKAVIVKSDGDARLVTLPNTLAALQNAVGGYIETLDIGGHVLAIVNEEGVISGLPVNVGFPHFRGDIVLLSSEGDEFIGLTDRQVAIVKSYLRDRGLSLND